MTQEAEKVAALPPLEGGGGLADGSPGASGSSSGAV